MKTYLYLASAILVEILATSSLNNSDGFTKLVPSALSLTLYAVSFFLLSKILTIMPVGIVYALWSGIGVVLITLVGIFFYNQKIDAPAMTGIAFITLGVVIINLFSASTAK